MDTEKLDDLVHNNISNLEEWTDIINNYMDFVFRKNKLNDEEIKDLTNEVAESFYSILQIFVEFGKFKDKWIDKGFRSHFMGIYYGIKSEKTGMDLEFGIDEKGLYLQTNILSGGNIKNMNDDFWRSFLELAKFGDFQFIEYSSPSTKECPQLFKGYKSNLFRLTRNYFLSEFQYGEAGILGYFNLRWDKKFTLDQILRNGCSASKILYQLNYSLWKISDLRSKKKS
jgi:hypothetical protein